MTPIVPLGYRTTCPNCGGPLRVHVGPAQDAPWLCDGCHHGWWCAELSDSARAAYRPRHGDFERTHPVHRAREVERAVAVLRRHSVPDELHGHPGVAERLTAFHRGLT